MLDARLRPQSRPGDRQGLPGSGRRLGQRNRQGAPCRAVGADHRASLQVRQPNEGVSVLDLEPSLRRVHRAHPYRLVHLLHFGERRVGRPVAVHQAVEAVRVEDGSRGQVVAAVGEVPASGGIRAPDALVGPVPDEPALDLRVALNHVPVLLEVAGAVSHRVRVLAEDQRALRVSARVVLQLIGPGVHRRVDVGVRRETRTLVLHGPARIAPLDPGGRRLEVDAVARLVSEGPGDDGRVVLVPLHHAARPVEVRLHPVRVVRERLVGVEADAVRFDVGFVHDVEAVLVAQLVPPGLRRVVRRADGVDVRLLHQPDVGQHRFFVDRVAVHRVVLVAVHPADEDGDAVDAEKPARDLHPPEADPRRDDLDRASVLVLDRQQEAVEARRFRGPALDARDHLAMREADVPAAADNERDARGRRHDGSPVRADQVHDERVPPGRPVVVPAHVGRHLQDAVREAGVEARGRLEIAEVHAGCREQVDAAEDPAQAPEVLALQVAAVAVAVDLHGQLVGPGSKEAGHVELGRRAAVLAVTHRLAVHPEVEGRGHAREVDEHLPAAPGVGQGELAPVRPYRIVVCRDPRRVRGEGIRFVDVERPSMPLPLGGPGDGDLAPVCNVEVVAIEGPGAVGRPRRPAVPPPAVERQVERGLLGPVAERGRHGGERHQRGVRRFRVDRRHARVLPVVRGQAAPLAVGKQPGRDDEPGNGQTCRGRHASPTHRPLPPRAILRANSLSRRQPAHDLDHQGHQAHGGPVARERLVSAPVVGWAATKSPPDSRASRRPKTAVSVIALVTLVTLVVRGGGSLQWEAAVNR